MTRRKCRRCKGSGAVCDRCHQAIGESRTDCLCQPGSTVPVACPTCLTFGALAIGETFRWRNTKEIQHGPTGAGPLLTKTDEAIYTFLIHGGPKKAYGRAEPHYPVRKATR